MFTVDEFQYYPVNWVDGMRISAKEMQSNDRAWQDAIRDVRATILQSHQYGLLPSLRDRSDRSGYPKFRYEPQKSLLTLLECRAITAGGYRIEITELAHKNHSVPLTLPAAKIDVKEDFEVYITVEMFDQASAGPISQSAPPRNLFLVSSYELSVLPKGIGLSGMNHLKVAEFNYTRSGIMPNEKYIPACITISAHPRAIERHGAIGSLLKSLYENGLNLYKQYAQDTRPSVKQAATWVEKWVLFIGGTLWSYNEALSKQGPLQTLIFIKDLAQFGLSTIEMYESNEFLRVSSLSQKPLFRNMLSPNLNTDNLAIAFDAMEAFLNGWLRWSMALGESLKVGREIQVHELK
jgi:hypothetical protein